MKPQLALLSVPFAAFLLPVDEDSNFLGVQVESVRVTLVCFLLFTHYSHPLGKSMMSAYKIHTEPIIAEPPPCHSPSIHNGLLHCFFPLCNQKDIW